MTQREANWTAVAFGLALAALAAYQQLKLPPVLPILIADYGFDRVLAGSFMSVYALCGLLLSLRLGRMMQRRGAIRLIYAAFALFVAGAALMMAWPASGWLFLAARAMEGAAFAILAIAGPAICTENAGTRGLPLASALIATWIPVGGLLANALAALGAEALGWRMLWWAGIAATLALALWTRRLQIGGRVRFTAVTASAAPQPTGALAAAERRRGRTMALSAFLFTLWSAQMFAYLTWLPDFLVDAHGFSPRAAAAIFMLPILVLTIFNLVGAPLLRAGAPVALLLAATAAVQTALWFAMPFTSGMAIGFTVLVLYAAAAGITPTCLFALPGTIYGIDGSTAGAFGVLMTGRNLGVLIGPVMAGFVVQWSGSWMPVMPLMGGLGVALTLGAVMLHWRLMARIPESQGTRR